MRHNLEEKMRGKKRKEGGFSSPNMIQREETIPKTPLSYSQGRARSYYYNFLLFIIINSKGPRIQEQRPSTAKLSVPHSGPLGSSVSIASFLLFSLFNGPPPPHFPPQITSKFPTSLKKKLQIHRLVIPHQFVAKQIVVSRGF